MRILSTVQTGKGMQMAQIDVISLSPSLTVYWKYLCVCLSISNLYLYLYLLFLFPCVCVCVCVCACVRACVRVRVCVSEAAPLHEEQCVCLCVGCATRQRLLVSWCSADCVWMSDVQLTAYEWVMFSWLVWMSDVQLMSATVWSAVVGGRSQGTCGHDVDGMNQCRISLACDHYTFDTKR